MKRIKTYKEYKLLYFDKLIEYKNNGLRYFYIYRITDLKNSKHYYGSRVSVCYPKYDLGEKYFSSSRDIAFLQAQKSYKERFKYKIIKIFNNNNDKILYESFLHQYFNVKNNDMFFNKVNQTPTRFDTTGFVTCLNLLTDEICFVTKEEFDNSYNLVGIGYGMVNCIDIQTNKFIRVSKEEFNSNPNLISISYGKVTCIDKISGKYKQVTKEEFNSNPNLVGVLYDKVNCIDKETNLIKQVTKEEFDSNPNLVGVIHNKVTCIDKETNLIKQVTKEEFDLNNNLVGIANNMVNCFDLETNTNIQVTKEEFYTNDNFLSLNKDKVICKYIGTDKIIKVSKEEFDSNPNLVGTTYGEKLDFTQEHKDNIGKGLTGKSKSKTHRENLSKANKGRVACKALGTEEIIFVSQEEFDSNPNLVGTTYGYIQCICTITKERMNINPLDLYKYGTFVPLNIHKVYTLKYPNGDIKILTDDEFKEEKEVKQLSHNSLMKSYNLNKPVEKSFDFYNKTFNQRIKNSLGFHILHIERRLY